MISLGYLDWDVLNKDTLDSLAKLNTVDEVHQMLKELATKHNPVDFKLKHSDLKADDNDEGNIIPSHHLFHSLLPCPSG